MSESFTVDTSGLASMIPEVVALTGRTIQEQCVTSIGWICVNAQKETPFVDVAKIDAEQKEIVKYTNKHPKFVKSGLATHGTMRVDPLPWTVGMMRVLSRMHPNSARSLSTGNRWPVAMPQTHGAVAFWEAVVNIANTQLAASRSSTHFLQAGWRGPIKEAFNSPAFKHSKKFRSASAETALNSNPLNDLDQSRLGDFKEKGSRDDFSVTAENAVGSRVGQGNAVMDEKHREALIAHGSIPLQKAVAAEEVTMMAEIDKRMAIVCKQVNVMLA